MSPALSICQLIIFNYQKRGAPTGCIVRHSKAREPPLTIYTALSIYARGRNKEAINELHEQGLAVFSTRVKEISSGLGHLVTQRAAEEGFLIPGDLQLYIFTALALDNIDHNPTSSTAVGSFHGTGMSVFQLKSTESEGQQRQIRAKFPKESKRDVPPLPDSYAKRLERGDPKL